MECPSAHASSHARQFRLHASPTRTNPPPARSTHIDWITTNKCHLLSLSTTIKTIHCYSITATAIHLGFGRLLLDNTWLCELLSI